MPKISGIVEWETELVLLIFPAKKIAISGVVVVITG